MSNPEEDLSSVEELKEAVELMASHTITDLHEGVQTLMVYVGNLLKFPEDKKYHKVKISNIHFRERLGRLRGCDEGMRAIGFTPDEQREYFVWQSPSLPKSGLTERLQKYEDVLSARIKQVREEFAALPMRLGLHHKYTSVQGAGHHNQIGRRATNEDDEIICDAFLGHPRSAYFGLYDGHGGRETVDYVVKIMHLTLQHILTTKPDTSVADALTETYLHTDGHVRRQNILQSGTTAVSCVIREETGGDGNAQDMERKAGAQRTKRMLYVANVGDSRAILSRKGEAIRLTIDHKPSVPEEEKRILDAGGFVGSGCRVNGVLAISRALGDHTLKSNDIVTARPYCRDIEIKDEDDFLLLACDGVWDVMQDQEAIDFVREKYEAWKTETPHMNELMERISEALVEDALDKQSTDNVTVMCIRL